MRLVLFFNLKRKKSPNIDGISCQHFQALMTQLLPKHWDWQDNKRKYIWHGSEKRPTMYVANMDTKTAFDVARPMHIATAMEDPNVHGWITAALLREIAGLEGQATFENVESTFPFA